VGGLAGMAKQEAGLASGLLNTSQQLGGAIGIAIASTVAATHLKTLLGEGQTPSAALTGGFHWALWVCGTVALLARPATAILARRTTPPRPRGRDLAQRFCSGGDGFRPQRGSQVR